VKEILEHESRQSMLLKFPPPVNQISRPYLGVS